MIGVLFTSTILPKKMCLRLEQLGLISKIFNNKNSVQNALPLNLGPESLWFDCNFKSKFDFYKNVYFMRKGVCKYELSEVRK